ncbi:MAG: zinc ribbon domain-containing protein [Acidimicrobiales bacterium]
MNRATLDKCWYAIEHRTDEKQARHGRLHVVARTPGTSATFVECAYVDTYSRESSSMFACSACGYEAHADSSAADEILERG